jgi:hypothetical protein
MKLINFFTEFAQQHPYTTSGIAAFLIIAAWLIYEIFNPFTLDENG